MITEIGGLKMAIYKFDYRCEMCDTYTPLRYSPPEGNEWVKLSCKNCERAVLQIYHHDYNTGYWNSGSWEHHYAIYDPMRQRYLLGEATDSGTVPQPSFLGWVIDHGGARLGD